MRRFPMDVWVTLALVGLALSAFGTVCWNGFVNCDDETFVTENPWVRGGLTWPGFRRAWAPYFGFWAPLTLLSYQFDAQFYQGSAGGFHATNLLFHAASSVVLYAALRRMTGARWRSALVAACFAVHPLNTEPVAWVAERKGVLAAFFWMLTLWAYARYAERPGPFRYGLTVLTFALGLMSKPVLVTLPCVLLLLDYWPLRRFSPVSFGVLGRLVREKAPLFGLAGAACVLAVIAEHEAGAVSPVAAPAFAGRLANAALAYVRYLGKAAWPTALAPFYPYPREAPPVLSVAGAIVFLAAVSVLVLRAAPGRPYLFVGWFWYLGTLLPVIGLIQVGSHYMADRYTYVPMVGLFLLSVWGGADLAGRWGCRKPALALAAVVLAAWVGCSRTQALCWHDSITLWEHTLRVTRDNALAYYNLGRARLGAGDWSAAGDEFARALEVDDRFWEASYGLGLVRLRQGNASEAFRLFAATVRINPDYAAAHERLGSLLLETGKPDHALTHLRRAVELEGGNANGRFQCGLALARLGDLRQALAYFREASRLRPDVPVFHSRLAFTLYRLGEVNEALTEYGRASRLDPGWPGAFIRDARVLATHPDERNRNGPLAEELALQACQATGNRVLPFLDTLAAAHASAGHFTEAVSVARQALERATTLADRDLATGIEERLRLYEKGQPFRDATAGKRP